MSKKSKSPKTSNRKAETRKAQVPQRRSRMIALEPRMLFDGALGLDLAAGATAALQGDKSAVDASTTHAQATAAPQEAPPSAVAAPLVDPREVIAEKPAADPRTDAAASTPHEILFIDGSLAGETIAQIKASTRPDVETIVLDPTRDGVQQISEILRSHDQLDAVHIVSHGGPGEIKLGTAVLSLDALQERAAEVSGWAARLDKGADLLLYGCDVAAGEMGAAYVGLLAQLTGADVAASTDTTGSFTSGGNWKLEVATGAIQASLFGDERLLTDGEIELANTAPVLDATKSPVCTAELEGAAAPAGAVGTVVSSLVSLSGSGSGAQNVTDPDVGANLGIAVVGADSANGTWYYSTNNGGTWSALGAVSTSSARLLAADANSRLYFKPNANWNGTVPDGVTFRAWDRTTGTNGLTGDTTANGGATAFSTATDTASIDVLSVNDAPSGASKTITIVQAGNYLFSAADFGFSDTDGNALKAVKIPPLPSGPNSIRNNGVSITAGTFIPVADIIGGRLQYVGDNPSSRSFTFQVQDGGAPASAA